MAAEIGDVVVVPGQLGCGDSVALLLLRLDLNQ